jgi:hypothetical protein
MHNPGILTGPDRGAHGRQCLVAARCKTIRLECTALQKLTSQNARKDLGMLPRATGALCYAPVFLTSWLLPP